MARNRVFFPQAALDEWVASDRVDVRGDELTIKGVQRLHKEQGARCLLAAASGGTADIRRDAMPVPETAALAGAPLSDVTRARLTDVLDDLETVKARIDQLLTRA